MEGVELSPQMHRAALANLERARRVGALRSPVKVRNEDVVAFELPSTPLVLFFFNGFERVVLREFAGGLGRSLRDAPRECYFVYVNPKNGDCLTDQGMMRELPMSPLTQAAIRLLSPWPMALYRTSAASAAE